MRGKHDESSALSRTGDILQRTVETAAAALTGIAASDRKEIVLSVGRVFQAVLAGKFLTQLKEQWASFESSGRIKRDYGSSSQSRACLRELLEDLDSGIPDEARFEAMKKVFLVAGTEDVSDRESCLPQQYMQIVRQLSAGEILVLQTTYSLAISREYQAKEHYGAVDWLQLVANKSGLQYGELVANHETALMEKNLITRRIHRDGSGVNLGQYFRLTELGYRFCSFIAHYDEIAVD